MLRVSGFPVVVYWYIAKKGGEHIKSLEVFGFLVVWSSGAWQHRGIFVCFERS